MDGLRMEGGWTEVRQWLDGGWILRIDIEDEYLEVMEDGLRMDE